MKKMGGCSQNVGELFAWLHWKELGCSQLNTGSCRCVGRNLHVGQNFGCVDPQYLLWCCTVRVLGETALLDLENHGGRVFP
jgi:hypothetical protein